MAFTNGLGFLVDDIQIAGQQADGAEVTVPWVYSPPAGGFRVVQGDLDSFFNAYVAEFRQYRGYDKGLRQRSLCVRRSAVARRCRTGSRTSRIRKACSSPIGTRASATTTPARIRAWD